MFPPECTVTVALYHLPTTGGAVQSYPGTADATTSGAFLPLDRKESALEGGEFVVQYELYLDPTVDVRIGDKAVISSTTYYVKSIFTATFGGLPHKRVSLSTQAT